MADPTTPNPPDLPAPEAGSGPPLLFEFSAEASRSDTYVPGAVTGPAITRTTSAPPVAFGRYQVRKALGEGGFGAVYLGHDTQLDRSVAIKVFRGGSDAPPAEADRLLHEARRLARLRHSGIVAVHDVGTQDGQVFIVSDYLDGHDLARWLKRNSPGWQQTVALVSAVADALAHAHAQSTIHRDVKPANIILTSGGAPVLVDFGLAIDDSSAGGGELGIVSGTPAYMAPEQVAGTAHRIDGRTDIYSLGVVLYEMLCGRIPFRAEKSHELLRQVRDDDPQPPRQIAREIPPELERICLKALAKKMQDRYTTAADFAEELRGVLLTASESATSPSSLRMPAGRQSATGMPAGVSYRDTSRHESQTLSSSRRRIREAERRQVTVLVCASELFESEGYLEIADAEDQAKMLQMFERVCERAVRGLDGTVVQCSEQGFLACFGYPVAYEDAARRSARAGLRMLDELKDLGDQLLHKHRLELNPWVGIHTGPAIVETKGDTVSLVGEARNAALRLGDVAVPGQLICTEDTHRLFRGRFRCVSLGQKKIKGVAQSVQLFQVEGIAWAGSLIEASAPTELSPLTGRDQETSLLKDRWEQATEGMGQIVLLIGEPGLGKSRLVYTLKEHVLGQVVEDETDSPVIEWRCSPQFQNTGLYPAIDFFERALEFSGENLPQERFDRLVRYLAQYELARPDTVPLWSSLLSLPTTDRFPPLALSPPRQREETFRAMVEWLRMRAVQRPILFIVEDLHWMDASTLEFLEQFIAEGLHDRILTVLTFRPEFKTPWPSVAHQTSLALNRLTRRQAGELMRKKSGGALSEALIEQVYDRTGGAPLFVEEFTKMVQESGAPAGAREGGAPATVLPAHQIPATLQDLMNARLDRMEGEQEVAQLAATLGREFSHELLSVVANMDEADLQSELDKLVRAEILFRKGRPPGGTYLFKHALLEDALYNSLVKSKRQEFHRRAALALEIQFPQTAEHRPELLAHHFTEAGLAEKGIDYWLQAGLRSKERSADVEAIGHLTKGLALLNTLEETPERDARELQFLTTLGPAYIAVRGYAAPEVGPVLLRARELCQRIGDPKQLFGIMLGMWEWRLVRGDLRLAVDLAADGIALAESMNDPGMLMEALFMPGATMFYRGQFAGARACCEKALAAYDDRERTKFWTAYTGHNAGVTHRNYLSLALWHLGYPDQALKIDREARELARTIGHAYSLGHAVDFTAYLSLYCRLGTEVQTAADEEMTLGAEQGFQLWHALGTLHKGAGRLLQGRREEALTLLVNGFAAFRATGAEVRAPSYLAMLGDAYTQCARFEEAHKTLDEALAVAEKNDDRCHEAEPYRLKGELVLAESPDQTGTAEDYFRQALDTARRLQSRAWELRATISLARLWQRQGRREEARDALWDIYGAYSEGFTTPDLVDAAALLESLS
ncbi:MAG TPA: protein kinase [Planctomycetaceae bacterium]|nr:protein kinase [Planctomycetaceae bacterium]